jgi:hypothetical protein
VLGLSLDHYYSIGFTYTREERDRLYADAFRQGRQAAVNLLRRLRPDLAAKYAPEPKQRTIEYPVQPLSIEKPAGNPATSVQH